ncbi:MAG: Fic family protein [Anaeroplasmataceae bacterium]
MDKFDSFKKKSSNFTSKVDSIRKKYEMYLPLSAEELSKINSMRNLQQVCYSNNIEGNSYTIRETQILLENGVVPNTKTLRESKEIENLDKAIKLSKFSEQQLDENLIKLVHKEVTNGILDVHSNEGNYRTVRNWVGGLHTCAPNGITKEMNNLIEWYTINNNKLHPIELSTTFKYRFLKIHPFIDGNGRTSRILLNIILASKGYIDCIIPIERKLDYYKALEDSDKLDSRYECSPLTEFIDKCLYSNYLEVIELLEDNY